jgi:TonB family protein
MEYLIDSFPTAFDVPNAKIALSQMVRDYYGDTTAADSILKAILTEHPRSDKIPDVMEILGLKGTEADTGYAERYVRKAEDFLVDNEDIDSAKYYYQYVVDNYPESNYYLHSRFALLWIMDEYEAPGDSTLFYAYTAFVDSFPGNEWATQINQLLREGGTKRVDYVEYDSTTGDTVPLTEEEKALLYADSIGVAQDINEADEGASYLDPIEQLAIAPDGSRCVKLPKDPIVTERPFVYPDAAYSVGWEGDLYFQILLDFSGEVTDYVLKIKSPNEAINREAEETIQTMKFDLFAIPTELHESWFYYKFLVRKPSQLR